ncbi:MAG: helix-turn-helix domain-containing protein [Brevibacillus sp.]|nr:helix-turn-helix domain-containing protein [Brevibacillus sp.]
MEMDTKGQKLLFTTLGERIQQRRKQANLTLSDLEKATGIRKGVISKIETGETKRPELKTIRPIAQTLGIPSTEIIEHYVEIDQRIDVLHELLMEAIELADVRLVQKVADRFVQSPHADSCTLLERLYNLTRTVQDVEMQLALYSFIVKYAREHGIQRFLAKALLQKYLIERLDMKRLEETFQAGEEILHYTDFLSQEERITLFFRLGLHAHNIKKYAKCIELCQAGLKEDHTSNQLKERAALALCNSYIMLGDYESAETYVDMFVKANYSFVVERAKPIRANILVKKGNYDAAIPLLKVCLEEATDDTRIHRVNDLIDALLHINDIKMVQQIIKAEEKILSFDPKTPYKHYEIGRYYRLKGVYLIKCGQFEEAIETYFNSISAYEKVNAYKEITQCISDILSFHVTSRRTISFELLEKLVNVYNRLNNIFKHFYKGVKNSNEKQMDGHNAAFGHDSSFSSPV